MTAKPNWHLEIQMDEEVLERAYVQAVSLFSDWDLTPPGVHTHLGFEVHGLEHVLDIKHGVVPPIAFALRHFGEHLPAPLVQKLRNKPQLEDTLFELLCLGMFAERHDGQESIHRPVTSWRIPGPAWTNSD
jgi:hypothetical protein